MLAQDELFSSAPLPISTPISTLQVLAIEAEIRNVRFFFLLDAFCNLEIR